MMNVFCTVLSGLEKYGFEVRQKHVHVHKPTVKSKPKGKRGAADIYQEAIPENIEVKIEIDIPTEEEPSTSYYLAESVVPPPPPLPDVPQNGNRDDDIEEPMDLDEFNENLTDEENYDEQANQDEVQDGEMRDASSEEEKQEEEDSDEEDCYNPVHKASSHEA